MIFLRKFYLLHGSGNMSTTKPAVTEKEEQEAIALAIGKSRGNICALCGDFIPNRQCAFVVDKEPYCGKCGLVFRASMRAEEKRQHELREAKMLARAAESYAALPEAPDSSPL
jgi:hypothetical protein